MLSSLGWLEAMAGQTHRELKAPLASAPLASAAAHGRLTHPACPEERTTLVVVALDPRRVFCISPRNGVLVSGDMQKPPEWLGSYFDFLFLLWALP